MSISFGIFYAVALGPWLENSAPVVISLGLYLATQKIPEWNSLKWITFRYLLPIWMGMSWINWSVWMILLLSLK